MTFCPALVDDIPREVKGSEGYHLPRRVKKPFFGPVICDLTSSLPSFTMRGSDKNAPNYPLC